MPFASASCCSACRSTYHGPYQWQEVELVFRTLLEMSRTLPGSDVLTLCSQLHGSGQVWESPAGKSCP